jgi:hypothetical protein
MNIEHVHAWTPDSMRVFLESVGGLRITTQEDGGNTISFITVAEKL